MSVGFIRDKLEIKFLILYVTAGVAEPMPLSGSPMTRMCRRR